MTDGFGKIRTVLEPIPIHKEQKMTDAEKALNMTTTIYDERATVIFNEILLLIDKLNIKNYVTRCDLDRYEIDLTSEYDDCKINLCWTDNDNVNIAYTSMFVSVNGQWNQGKQWSNTRYIEDVKNRLVEWAQNLHNPVSEAKYVLIKIIRERDEQIAAQKAEEEAALVRQMAEIRIIEEKKKNNWEHVKNFIKEIGDFEMPGSRPEDHRLTVQKRILTWENNSDFQKYELNLFGNKKPDSSDIVYLVVNESNLQEIKNKIIQWAVDNGAREPNRKI